MSQLKLGKLPDRTPVKMTITVNPDLAQGLRDYAAIYRTEYGEAVSVGDLVPFMVGAFLESDKGFAKARKELPLEAPVEAPENHRPSRSRSHSRSTPSQEGMMDTRGRASPSYPRSPLAASSPQTLENFPTGQIV